MGVYFYVLTLRRFVLLFFWMLHWLNQIMLIIKLNRDNPGLPGKLLLSQLLATATSTTSLYFTHLICNYVTTFLQSESIYYLPLFEWHSCHQPIYRLMAFFPAAIKITFPTTFELGWWPVRPISMSTSMSVSVPSISSISMQLLSMHRNASKCHLFSLHTSSCIPMDVASAPVQ